MSSRNCLDEINYGVEMGHSRFKIIKPANLTQIYRLDIFELKIKNSRVDLRVLANLIISNPFFFMQTGTLILLKLSNDLYERTDLNKFL